MLRLFADPIREQERIIMSENKKKPGHIHSIRVRDDSDLFTGTDRGTGSLYAGEYVFPGTILY